MTKNTNTKQKTNKFSNLNLNLTEPVIELYPTVKYIFVHKVKYKHNFKSVIRLYQIGKYKLFQNTNQLQIKRQIFYNFGKYNSRDDLPNTYMVMMLILIDVMNDVNIDDDEDNDPKAKKFFPGQLACQPETSPSSLVHVLSYTLVRGVVWTSQIH